MDKDEGGVHMAKKPSIDDLRHEYVTSSISLRALAEKHGVPVSALYRASKLDSWNSKRQTTSKMVAKKAITKTISEQAAHMAKIIKTTDMLGDKLQMLIEALNPIEPDAFKDSATLTRAWKDYLSSNTLVRGLMTPMEEAQLDIARKRLDMDREKLEREAEKDQAQDIEVIFGDKIVEGEWQK